MFTNSLIGRYKNVHTPLCSHTCTASPPVNIPHWGGTFVTLDKPSLMYHYHPKSLVYIRVQSCIFYGFGQVCNDMYPLLITLIVPNRMVSLP